MQLSTFLPRTFSQTLATIVLLTGSLAASAAGLLTPKQSHLSVPEIRSHHVNVSIENGYAITSVDQVFFNPNPGDIEATYSFPVPKSAAVGEFTYWIDEQPVTGEVIDAENAKKIYETEKAFGNETALVTKNSYKAFETSVYPIRGQQEVRVRLVYIQPVHIDSAVGRYVYPLENGGTDTEQTAFWQFNSIVKESFSFALEVRSSYPLDEVRLPQHPNATVNRESDFEWEVQLGAAATASATNSESTLENHHNAAAAYSLDQDIVVYWRLKSGLPGSVDLVTHREPGQREGTFMLTLTPADDLDEITQGRDWVFVLDFSGSMQGKYATLVDGVQRALRTLHPDDRFRIFLFNNKSWEITNGFVFVSSDMITHYSEKLNALHPDGGTNLYAGLNMGLRGLDSDRVSGIILVTDGVANVGKTEKKAFLSLLEQHDARLFTFVMGNGANRPLLESMASVSEGFATNASNGDDIYGKVLLAAGKLSHNAIRDINVDIKGVKVTDLTPARISSLYHGQQMIVMGHFYADLDDDAQGQLAKLSLTGKIGDRTVNYNANLDFAGNNQQPELERLWAFSAIEALQSKLDYLGDNADTQQALIDIAVQNSLVTNHTSMIVVRDDRFAQYQINRNNNQRVVKENLVRSERAAQPVKNSQQQVGPNLSQQRAYPSGGSSGGGAIGGWFFLIVLPLLFAARKKQLVGS